MLELIAKLNIVLGLFKYIKEYKIITIFVIALSISVFCLVKGIIIYADNSVYKDSKEDRQIKESIKNVLTKCGDSHSLGLSTISTDIKTDYYAKFKELMSCDYHLNPDNCIMDLTAEQFPFGGDYLVDKSTYYFLKKLSTQEDVEKIHLPSFDIEEFPTIKKLIEMSEHFKSGEMQYVYLTAVENHEKNLIYAISLTSWAKEPCVNAKYLLNKLKKSLPITK